MSEEVKPATCEWCKRFIARHLDAYYYGFSATGVKEIDNILCSVASAGKAYHYTEDWAEGGYPELIQRAASEAAVRIDAERALNAELTERYNELVQLTVPSDSDAEEKANLRAMNAEMLAEVQRLRSLIKAVSTCYEESGWSITPEPGVIDRRCERYCEDHALHAEARKLRP